MNKILEAMIKTAEAVAIASVPGGAQIDSAIHGLVEKKEPADAAVLDLAEGAIKAIESFKEADIADEIKFRAGVATLEAGFRLVKESLKAKA